MTKNRRYYKAGVKEALFMLSRGRCYAPKCPQRVLRMVDDDPSINIQVAHINGLNVGSARYDETISVETLNSFGNLLLLCQAHHGPVDDRSKESKYPTALLLAWKKDREGAAYEQLAGLDLLGREDVEAMLVSAISDTKEELLGAIDEVAAISKGTAETLRRLVAETFDRPYLDLDAVALLADSAASLRHLPGSADQLSVAAESLKHLPASVDVLSSTAPFLRGLGLNASTLSSAAEGLTNLDQSTGEIRSAASELRSALHHAGSGPRSSCRGLSPGWRQP